MNYFGSNMAYLRNVKYKTQKDIAKYIGCTPAAIANYEGGKREPELKVAAMIAQFLGVSLDEMILKEMQKTPILLCKNLKYLRKREGYRQEDMSAILGYSHKSSFCLLENGRYEPDVKGLVNLAEFFGVTVDDLLKKDLEKEGI